LKFLPCQKKQCGEFVQHLVTKFRSQVCFNEFSDDMLEAIYLETQGIPGRVIAELPNLEGAKQSDNSLWILIAAVAGLVALALFIQWFSGSEYNIKLTPAPVIEVHKSTGSETTSP
jgi:DamX protein